MSNDTRTYSGGIVPKFARGGNPTPNDPGIMPPTIWADVISTLAVFEGVSSSGKKWKEKKGYQMRPLQLNKTNTLCTIIERKYLPEAVIQMSNG